MKQPMEINIFLKQSVENFKRNNNESEQIRTNRIVTVIKDLSGERFHDS